MMLVPTTHLETKVIYYKLVGQISVCYVDRVGVVARLRSSSSWHFTEIAILSFM